MFPIFVMINNVLFSRREIAFVKSIPTLLRKLNFASKRSIGIINFQKADRLRHKDFFARNRNIYNINSFFNIFGNQLFI